MRRAPINENIQRRLYAESMGKCMNPNCLNDLFGFDGDIIEKAHIDPYCETANNTFENLVVLCPNCHTNFDKNKAYTPEEVLSWKAIRQQEINDFFGKHFDTFEGLKEVVQPLLLENKTIYENYYLRSNRHLWDQFEIKILINNRKIKELIKHNLNLFQTNINPSYSNLNHIYVYLQHIEEFEATRGNAEKIRTILYPPEVDSIFEIAPVDGIILPSTESLESLITKLNSEGNFNELVLDNDTPFLSYKQNGKDCILFLSDTPRVRQIYYDYCCFAKTGVRLNSLIFVLKYINRYGVKYMFSEYNRLREIYINNTKIYFVYKYCLSEMDIRELAPEETSMVVNLHNWNREGCISHDAHMLAEQMNVDLLTTNDFYEYIKSIRFKK